MDGDREKLGAGVDEFENVPPRIGKGRRSEQTTLHLLRSNGISNTNCLKNRSANPDINAANVNGGGGQAAVSLPDQDALTSCNLSPGSCG